MELELERIPLDGFLPVLDAPVAQEETMESIVPDACPDLLSICDTEGVVCLHRKEAMEGRVELSGAIHAMLMCQPDGENGLRRLEVELPFTCTADAPGITPDCRVVAMPRLRGRTPGWSIPERCWCGPTWCWMFRYLPRYPTRSAPRC